MSHTIFGSLGNLIFWAVLAVLIYVLVRATINRVGRDNKSNDPIDILRRRYARGEIDKEEFERLMADLKRAK